MYRISLTIVLLIASHVLHAQVGDNLEVGVVEHLGDTIPMDARMVDEDGNEVIIGDLIDKPTILNFVYYRCPGICSPLMDGLADVIDASDLVIGKDYQALTISFDPREGTMLAERKKNNYVNLMEKKDLAETGWKFFTSDSASIARLTDATGFKYKPTGNDFIHAAVLVIVDENGRISRYMNGTYFLPFELKMSIIDASEGKSGPTFNRVLQYCYSYDPEGQGYVLNITKISATLIIFFAVVLFLVLLFFRKKKPA